MALLDLFPRRVTPRPLGRRAFWRRFGRIEHAGLEFKASSNHLAETVVAMAMTSGGHLVLGVADDRRLIGQTFDQPTLDRIAHVAQETGVDLEVEPLRVDGIPILVVSVPAVHPRVVTTPDGRLLRRIGGTNQPLRGDAVTRFLEDRLAVSVRGPLGARAAHSG